MSKISGGDFVLRKIKFSFLIVVIILSSLLLSSCRLSANFGVGTRMPDLKFVREFENDTWLVIESSLTNKSTGKEYKLSANENATIAEMKDIDTSFHFDYIYKVEFFEENIKLYSFTQGHYYGSDGYLTSAYFDGVFTYNYEGEELDRKYLSGILTYEEFKTQYYSNFNEFTYEIDDSYIMDQKKYFENSSEAKREILDYAEKIYEKDSNLDTSLSETEIQAVVGTVKRIQDEYWFSVTVFPYEDFPGITPIFPYVEKTSIMSYNSETKEFKTIFELEEKEQAIFDFDEKRFFAIDSDMNVWTYDFETKESSLIYTFEDDYTWKKIKIYKNQFVINFNCGNKTVDYFELTFSKTDDSVEIEKTHTEHYPKIQLD